MTALESYYDALARGHLPGTVPVTSRGGDFCGIATVAIIVSGVPRGEELILSPRPNDRAAAAVMACSTVVKALRQHDYLVARCQPSVAE